MSELGDDFRLWKEQRQKKRWSNYKSSLSLLKSAAISFKVCNEANGHILVEDRFDFWPTTGKWRERGGLSFGRGVRSLIREVKRRGDERAIGVG